MKWQWFEYEVLENATPEQVAQAKRNVAVVKAVLMTALICMVPWLLPARHNVRVMEAADDVWPRLQVMIAERAKENKFVLISSTWIISSNMNVSRIDEPTDMFQARWNMCRKECAQPDVHYFFHRTRQWYWPWWRDISGEDEFYTHPITMEEVFAHGHVSFDETRK
jgi:hypothetical protein